MTSVLIIGDGIAGLEAAATISASLPHVDVSVVGNRRTLNVTPQLAYAPFGIAVDSLAIDIRRLFADKDVSFIDGVCESVNVATRTIQVNGERVPYDALVVATGATEQHSSGMRLRSVADAEAIGVKLREIVAAEHGGRIIIRVLPESGWTGAACEFALLVSTWLSAHPAHDPERTTVSLAFEDSLPVELLGYAAASTTLQLLLDAGVNVLRSVPHDVIESLEGDLVVDFGGLVPRRIAGLPTTSNGFLAVDGACRVGPGVYAVGDAIDSPWKAGFAAGWHAQLVARDLGASEELLYGLHSDSPRDRVIYPMDIGTGSLVVSIDARHALSYPWLSVPPRHEVSDQPPHKLQGLLLHDYIRANGYNLDDAGSSFRDRIGNDEKHPV